MGKKIDVELRKTATNDLETLFKFQLDKEANYLAAFTSENPGDKRAYIDKWTKLLLDEKINVKTILLNSEIVGSVAKYEMNGNAEITYWIGKKYWGKGIASNALKKFLKTEKARPIYGRVAFDNIGSIKVLENCGFSKIGTESGFANARKEEIEEFIFELK
jgi:RimJ/RimL family protein N-acetyltransferase